MDLIIIFCAKYLIFIIMLLAFVYWLTISIQNKVMAILYGAITAIVAFLLAKIGSLLINDPRPFVSDHVTPLFKYVADNGFPSDHTLLGASIALAVMFVSKRWGIGLMLLTIVVGSSRVLAHVHHPIDILGSLIFASVGGTAAYFLAPKIFTLLSRKFTRLSKTPQD